MIPSHESCLELLRNPSTQNILEKLGYDYSESGLFEFRKARPNIVPILVQTIVTELANHPIFPPSSRKILPHIGLYIQCQAEGFAVVDIDKPSMLDVYVHPTPEGAARSYIYKLIDSYWLQFDRANATRVK
jgi:hypothetical protein